MLINFSNRGSVRMQVQSARDGVEIHVIDTRIGNAMDHHARCIHEFDAKRTTEFATAKRAFDPGSAGGRRPAQSPRGGNLAMDTATGAGSRVTLILPAPGNASTTAAGAAPVPVSA